MTSLFKCVTVVFFFHIGSVGALEVTFATFNTFWLFDNDPPYQNWWNENRGRTGQTYQQAINAVAEAIKSTGADIIALQEIEDEEIIADLKARLRNIGVDYPFSWVGKGSDTLTGQDVALLSKFPQDGVLMQEYPDEREYYLTETDPGSEAETELSKVLRVDLNIDNEIVSVFVFHLKSNGGGFEADQQRLAQASIIRRITLPLIQDGRKFVVMGDLNADRGSPAILRIRGLDDIYPDLTQTTYDNNFIGNKWSFEYQGRTQQLDYILLSPALRRTMKSGKINYLHGHDASDHYPVIVVLDI